MQKTFDAMPLDMAEAYPITTKRLLLRPVELSDALTTARLMTLDVAACLLAWPGPMRVEQAEARIRASIESRAKREAIDFAILDRASHHLMGWIGFWLIAPAERRARIGFWLGSNHQGRGYMLEAATAALPMGAGHVRAKLVEGMVSFDNLASKRILERLGFTYAREDTAYFPIAGVDKRCKIYTLRI